MDRDAIERYLGLDVTTYQQYGRWLGIVPQADGSFDGIAQGNLGTFGDTVRDLLDPRLRGGVGRAQSGCPPTRRCRSISGIYCSGLWEDNDESLHQKRLGQESLIVN